MGQITNDTYRCALWFLLFKNYNYTPNLARQLGRQTGGILKPRQSTNNKSWPRTNLGVLSDRFDRISLSWTSLEQMGTWSNSGNQSVHKQARRINNKKSETDSAQA